MLNADQLHLIRSAVQRVLYNGMTVLTDGDGLDEYGVERHAITGVWGASSPGGPVSLLGAIVLLTQPQCDEDMPCPASIGLGASIACADGLQDGWDHAAQVVPHSPLSRAHYLSGYVAGVLLRDELVTRVAPLRVRNPYRLRIR